MYRQSRMVRSANSGRKIVPNTGATLKHGMAEWRKIAPNPKRRNGYDRKSYFQDSLYQNK